MFCFYLFIYLCVFFFFDEAKLVIRLDITRHVFEMLKSMSELTVAVTHVVADDGEVASADEDVAPTGDAEAGPRWKDTNVT